MDGPGSRAVTSPAPGLRGLVITFGCPLVFLVLRQQWVLLALYACATTGFLATLTLRMCRRRLNFACPLNSVGDAARDLFFQRNPSVAEHWRERSRG